MRTLLILATLTAALAGCSDATDSTDMPPATGDIQLVRDLPANFTATQDVTGSFDPLNFAMGQVCTSPTATCFTFDFTVNASRLPDNVTEEQAEGRNRTEAPLVHMEAALAWPGVSDFDFYLYEGSTQLVTGANNPTASPVTNSEAMMADLDEGTYTIVVVGWLVLDDTFTLDVQFSTA